MSFEAPIIFSFLGYLILTLAIGIIAYKATTTLSDYILGGRKLGPTVTAFSVGASDMSGWLLLGLPGAIYLSGASQIWIGVGLVIGAFFNWQLVARRLRQQTQDADDALTLPDFFEKRLKDDSGLIRLLSAMIILVFFTFYASSGLVGGAILFEKVFGLSYTTALLIGSVVIVSYTFIGGFLAVSWTDFFQGVLMLLALIILPMVALTEIGGWDAAASKINDINPEMLNFGHDFTWLGFISLMAWGLGYFGQPHILSRFMAIESVDHIGKSRNIAMSWMVLSLLGALSVGLVGAIYFADSPLENSETVFLYLTQAIFNPWIAGILIAAILSAIMSTIDSQLLVSSSVVVEDFYKRFVSPEASENQLVWTGRIAVLVIAAIAILIAWDPQSSVLSLVSYAWAGFGAAFGPTVLLALYWKDYSKMGALASLVSGAITVVVWKELSGGIFDLYEIVPGFIIASVLGIIVSRLTLDENAQKMYHDLTQNK